MLTGIDAITYGVEDMERSAQFFLDWGLTRTVAEPGRIVFETLDGGEVVLRPADAPDLPPPFESGSTLRRVTWGVRSARALKALAGIAADPTGLAIDFRPSRRRKVAVKGSPANTIDRARRIDAPSPVYERAQPVKIGHVVLFVADVAAAEAFYVGRLGFVPSDRYPGEGVFLRCNARGGHHDLFLLKHPAGRPGLNHVAFTVRDIHEVFGGGLHIARQGWQTQIGPGRHPISSAFFWYFRNPAGGLAEYYTDEDHLTERWVARSFERRPELFAEWAIAGGLDPATRRQRPPA
ncbi:MAG: VOC family protein [Thalassobaculales bacterium]